jgi:hypothetical protein
MTPDDERPDDLEWRLHAMLAQRAEAVQSELSGPALRARARQRPAARRFVPPLAAAAAVAAVAIGIAVAGSGGGEQHQTPAGGSAPPAVSGAAPRPSSHPHPKASPTHARPVISGSIRLPAPGVVGHTIGVPSSAPRGESRSVPGAPSTSPSMAPSTAPRPPIASSLRRGSTAPS